MQKGICLCVGFLKIAVCFSIAYESEDVYANPNICMLLQMIIYIIRTQTNAGILQDSPAKFFEKYFQFVFTDMRELNK